MLPAVIEPLGAFVVDLSVSADNQIRLTLDHLRGITIEECVQVSRALEEQLNRDEEDFSLEVSSADLTAPFVHPLQYRKHIGKPVTVITKGGLRYDGTLTNAVLTPAEDALAELTVAYDARPVAKPGAKRKAAPLQELTLTADEIKSVCYRF